MDIKILFSKTLKNILIAFPYAFLISLFMSIGGLVQQVFVKFFTSEEVNLYDMMHEGIIVLPPNEFLDCIFCYYQVLFLLPSLLIIIFCFHEKHIKQKLFCSSAFIFLTLTFTDLFYYFLGSEDIIVESILTSILVNLIGAPLITLILFIIVDIKNQINSSLQSFQCKYYQFISSLSIIIIGIILTSMILYIHKGLYTVTNSTVDLIVKPHIQGFYGNNNKKEKENTDSMFSLLHTFSVNPEKFFFQGIVHHENDFVIKWDKELNKKSDIYNIEVRLIDGLKFVDSNTTKKLLSYAPTYLIKNIQNIKFSLDHNSSLGLQVMPKDLKEGGSIIHSSKDLKLFDISEKDKKFTLSNYIYAQKHILKHISWENEVSYVISLVNVNENKLTSTKISIDTDKENLEIKYFPDNNMTYGVKKFHQVLAKSKDSVYKTDNFMNGVILTFKRISKSPINLLNSLKYKNETLIKGASGFLTINEVNKKDLSLYFNDGTLNWLGIHAQVEELIIDGKKYNKLSNFSNELAFIGDTNLTGAVLDKGFLRFTGSSNAIYINRKRANLSRWEKLDLNMLYFLGIFGVIIIFVFNRLKYIMSKELDKN